MSRSFDQRPDSLWYDDGARRLLLRAARVEDARDVVAAIDESRTELRRFLFWAHQPQTMAIQVERLKHIQKAARHEDGDYIFHLLDHEEGPFLGALGLHRGRNMCNRMGCEIGFWTRANATGRGLTTLAVQSALVFGFDYLGLTRIQCFHNEANQASARVQRKAGFRHEGTLRAYERAATAEERARGCLNTNQWVLNALVPEDRAELAWYAGTAAHLTVRDAAGNVLKPTAPGSNDRGDATQAQSIR